MKQFLLAFSLLFSLTIFAQESNTEITKISHPDYIEYTFKSNHASEPSDIRQHLPSFMDKYDHLIDITIGDDKIVRFKAGPEFDENQTLKQILSRFRCPHYTLQSL